MQQLIRATGIRTVRLARRWLYHTPVRRWPLTARLYRMIMRLLYHGRDLEVVYKGHTLLIPGGDCTISPGLIGGFYETLALDAFGLACAGRRCVLDVGGNIGLYTVHAAQQLASGGTVHAFEPVPANRRFLEHNIAANKATGVRAVGLAIGAAEGPLTLYLDDRDSGTHSAAPMRHARQRATVWMTTVDTYVARRRLTVDVVKIDVKGYDAHALRGATATLVRDRPTIFVEYAPQPLRLCGSTVEDFVGPLRGYRFCVSFDEVRREIRPIDVEQLDDSPQQSNLMVTDDVELYHAVLSLSPVTALHR